MRRTIDHDEERALVANYQSRKCQRSLGKLLDQHERFLANHVGKYYVAIRQHQIRDDLLAAAKMGFVVGIQKFDPGSKGRLWTYAKQWVRYHVQTEACLWRCLVKVSGLNKNTFILAMQHSHGQALKLQPNHSMRQVNHVTEGLAQRHQYLGIQTDFCEEDPYWILPGDLTTDEPMYQQEVVSLTRRELARLEPREQQIVEMLYVKEMTMTQIGQELKISRERVSQVRDDIQAKLSKRPILRELAA